MKLKQGEWVVVSRLSRYQEPENATFLRWRSFTPYWWAVFQGLWENLLQPGLWEVFNDDIKNQIIEHFFDETFQCPEPPTPEPPTPEPPEVITAGGAGLVGTLGLTIEEMESLLMSTIMGIRWNNGKLEVQYFPCCTWVEVSGLAGGVIGQQSAPAAGKSLGDFLSDNSLGLPSLPIPVLPPAQHNTADSIRCSKATAMQDGWFLIMYELRDLLDAIDLSNVTIGIILELAAGVILTGGWGVAAAVVVAITTYVNDTNIAALKQEMIDQWNNTAMRTNIICAITTSLSEGTEITAQDLRIFESEWESIAAPSSALANFMKLMPGGWIRDEMQKHVDQTPCACDQYKPFNYTLPPAAGFGVDHHALAKNWGGATPPQYDNLPLDAMDTDPRVGTLVGGYARSGFMYSSSGYIYMGVGQILFPTENFNLQAIRIQWTNTNVARTQMVVSYIPTSTNLWNSLAMIEDNTAPIQTELYIDSFANVEVSAIAFNFMANAAQSSGLQAIQQITSIQITGSVGGVPFVDLEIGDRL